MLHSDDEIRIPRAHLGGEEEPKRTCAHCGADCTENYSMIGDTTYLCADLDEMITHAMYLTKTCCYYRVQYLGEPLGSSMGSP